MANWICSTGGAYSRCFPVSRRDGDCRWGRVSPTAICICAAAGGTSEVGRALADYVDPYNVRSGPEQLLHYLNNLEARSRREQIIAQSFDHRSWREVAGDLLAAAKSMHFRVARGEGIAAITLPPNKFMPITVNAREFSLTAEDGSLSAELACVAGWRAPEVVGVWAERPEATLQFRTKSVPGAKIHLILHVACPEGSSYRLRIKSATGSEVSVSLGGGGDTFATLWCEVDKTGLVNVSLSCVGQEKRASSHDYWCLRASCMLSQMHSRTRKIAPTGRRDGTTQHLGSHFMPTVRGYGCVPLPPLTALGSFHAEEFINAKDAFWSLPTSIKTGGHPFLSTLRTSGSSSPDTGIPNVLILELFRKALHSCAAVANICRRRGLLRASFSIRLGYAGDLASWMAHLCLTTRGSFGIERASLSSADLSTGHLTTITLSSSFTTAISTTIITGWWRVSCRSICWSTPFYRTKTVASRCQSRWTSTPLRSSGVARVIWF